MTAQKTPLLLGLIAAVFLAVVPPAAEAESPETPRMSSAYERIDLDACETIEETERSAFVRCATGAPYPDLVFEWHDHGYDLFLAGPYEAGLYGEPNQLDQPPFRRLSAAGGFPGPTRGEDGKVTLEWRVRDADGEWVPFGLIMRETYVLGFSDNHESRRATRLRVIAFDGDQACPIALISGLEDGHNVLAREAIDATVTSLACDGYN